MNAPAIAIVGLGPRAISTIERLAAYANIVDEHDQHPFTLHLIDDARPGGRIWDTRQDDTLCMNTHIHGMTLFSEPVSQVLAPVVEGPTIYEWIRFVLGATEDLSDAKRTYLTDHPPRQDVVERYGTQFLEELRPESYAPRALYGYYLEWVYESAIASLPNWGQAIRHQTRAVDIKDQGEADLIELADGTTVKSTTTVLITGWQQQGLTPRDEALDLQLRQHPELRWIRPNNPTEQPLHAISPQDNVLIRGLGMSFFDTLSLLTIRRGGRFSEDEQSGKLRYEASGNEPHIVATSRRGFPFLPQRALDALPALMPTPRLNRAISAVGYRSEPASIDFSREIWPALAKDVYSTFVETLSRRRPSDLTGTRVDILAAIDAAPVVTGEHDRYGIAHLDSVIRRGTQTRFSLNRWFRPLSGTFADPAALTKTIATRLDGDIAAAIEGTDNPERAALEVLSSARLRCQVIGAEGRYTRESRTEVFDKVIALGQMVGSGPPLFRIKQLRALIDADIVEFAGAHPTLTIESESGDAVSEATESAASWVLESPSIPGHHFAAKTVVDAWVEKPTILIPPADPLTRNLLDKRRLTPFEERAANGQAVPTDSPYLDPVTRRAIGLGGTADPRLQVVGLPAHAQYPDTAISPPIPGTDSWFIKETDRAAVAALDATLHSASQQLVAR